MRIWVSIVLVGALAWAGWWVFASRAAEQAAQDWFASAADRGIAATQDGISVRGFPNRIDLRIEAPALAPTAGGVAWSSPFLEVFALSYRPWHVIVVPGPRQEVRLPQISATLVTEDARASVVMQPRKNLALDRATVVLQSPVLTPAPGGTLRAEEVRAALRAVPGPEDGSTGNARYQVGLQTRGLRLDEAVMGWIGPAAARLPGLVETLRLDATLELTAPLAPQSNPPRIAAIEISEARLQWGSLGLAIRGSLAPDATGRAEGTLDLEIEDWPAALGLARLAGLVGQKDARSLEALLNGLAPVARDGGRLRLPLTFAAGVMRLGPLVLGPAPRL